MCSCTLAFPAKMKINMINAKAFTLVETLIVVLLSTVALAGVYATLNVGQKAWVFYNDSVAVKKEARRALFALATELREAENLKVIQGPGGTTVHFHRPDRKSTRLNSSHS